MCWINYTQELISKLKIFEIMLVNLLPCLGSLSIPLSFCSRFFFLVARHMHCRRNGMPAIDFFFFATPAGTTKSTIGIPNNPFDSPLFGAIVRFISMLHHQNYEFHTKFAFASTYSHSHARMHAYSHVRTPTPITHTQWMGWIFRSFSCKIYFIYIQLPLAAIQSKYVL